MDNLFAESLTPHQDEFATDTIDSTPIKETKKLDTEMPSEVNI